VTVYGAAHDAGSYHVATPGTGSFIRDGVELIKDIGFGAVKLFLSRNYATSDYALESTWSGTPTTLTQLAQQPPMAAVLGDATLKHFILNSFGFTTLGDTDPWKFGLAFGNSDLLENEYTEIRAFAEHLLSTYNGDAKTFVIKNWEGDWSLQGSTVLDGTQYNARHSRREDLMIAFFRARWQAIVDARAAVASDCRVLHAIEVNRVTESLISPNAPRMIKRVLPRMRGMLDLVSYSAYDSVFDLSPGGTVWGSNAAAHLADINARLPAAIQALEEAADVPCMIGEWGIPENELPLGYSTADIVQTVFDIGEDEEIVYHVYWQVFDNEGTPPSNRGFWLYDDAGALTEAGTKWTALL
jgi:hypothetical protein